MPLSRGARDPIRTTSAAFLFAMLLPPRFSPLLAGAICGAILLGVGAMFISQLRLLGARLRDAGSVRSEVQRVLQAALPAPHPGAGIPVVVAESDRKAEAVVAEIGTRMRELGAPLWEDQASVIQHALTFAGGGDAVPPVLPDEVIGEAAPVLSPRQKQILALVQAESRWAEAMRGDGGLGADGDVSLRKAASK